MWASRKILTNKTFVCVYHIGVKNGVTFFTKTILLGLSGEKSNQFQTSQLTLNCSA